MLEDLCLVPLTLPYVGRPVALPSHVALHTSNLKAEVERKCVPIGLLSRRPDLLERLRVGERLCPIFCRQPRETREEPHRALKVPESPVVPTEIQMVSGERVSRRLYNGSRAVPRFDRADDRGIQDPPLPERPPRRERLGCGTQETTRAPSLGGRDVEWFVVRKINPHRGMAVQASRHLRRLCDGGFQDAPPVGPLEGKVLEDQESHLVARFVEPALGDVGVYANRVHPRSAHQ
jgi:hypothetical protein